MEKYIKTGKCIWCGKEEPEATFYTEPHILPHSLGGLEIGFDICDECNHYFGTATKGKPSIDLVYKEIMNAYRVFGNNLNRESYKKLNSVFFSYYHSKGVIKMRSSFNLLIITRQFKRSLYNIFLQKYHSYTSNGNHPMFSFVRDFARFDIGNPKVFYAFNNVLFIPDNINNPSLLISDKVIDDMMSFGVFPFWCMGQYFYLEIFPTIFKTKGYIYLQNQANTFLINALGNERILELTDIRKIDFFMLRFSRTDYSL